MLYGGGSFDVPIQLQSIAKYKNFKNEYIAFKKQL